MDQESDGGESTAAGAGIVREAGEQWHRALLSSHACAEIVYNVFLHKT